MNNQIGLYGLGVMGQSLALNLAGHDIPVSVYNKFDYSGITRPFVEKRGKGLPVEGFEDLPAFVNSLQKPRKIILMATAGKVIDDILAELTPLLEEGDIVADCGNSHYRDTKRREEDLRNRNLHFYGVGVSGGEKGALTGPSIMPGGNQESYEKYLGPVLETIAAKADGEPCCAYIGPDGAGHYVKMVHNGIEYGDIQIICEAYSLMKSIGLSNEEMADVFERWNQGRLQSYLIEITSKILRRKDDETGEYLIDVILDEAGQKGTGKWTSIDALDTGTAAPTIIESVLARALSAAREERVQASASVKKERIAMETSRETFLEDLEQAVYASKIVSYAQGFELLHTASLEHEWNLNLGRIAMLWRQGCIIRAQFLNRIHRAYEDGEYRNLMMTPEFKSGLEKAQPAWRRICLHAIAEGIYAPCIVSALQYFDGYTTDRLPANLLQAQRDWFGAHTYRRTDRPHEESFHTIWEPEE